MTDWHRACYYRLYQAVIPLPLFHLTDFKNLIPDMIVFMENLQTTWQVETQGQIYEAEFEELKQWIIEGAVLPSDKVKRGNLRWLPVEKVPEIFNLCQLTDHYQLFSESADCNLADIKELAPDYLPAEKASPQITGAKVCFLHIDAEAFYACAICVKLFCRICPASYGGDVKICPLCGSLCNPADQPLNARKAIGAISKPYYKVNETQFRGDFLRDRISKSPHSFFSWLQNIKKTTLKAIQSGFSFLSKKGR